MALAQHQVPKKLTAGMAVVIYIRPGTYLDDFEFKAGFRAGEWHKVLLAGIHHADKVWYVKLGNTQTSFGAISSILVRSTSWDDSETKKRVDKRNAAKYRKLQSYERLVTC
jgi:hypothetical protein